MNRKTFIRQCGTACIGMTGIAMMLDSCSSTQPLALTITDNKDMVVPLSLFSTKNKTFKRFVVVGSDQLNYPLVVFRHSPTDYTALLLRCSHQYNELTANGDILVCPAHGSEFNNRGEVIQGPADEKLRSFPVTITSQSLLINLV